VEKQNLRTTTSLYTTVITRVLLYINLLFPLSVLCHRNRWGFTSQ